MVRKYLPDREKRATNYVQEVGSVLIRELPDLVREISLDYAEGDVTFKELGVKYGLRDSLSRAGVTISAGTVTNIVRRVVINGGYVPSEVLRRVSEENIKEGRTRAGLRTAREGTGIFSRNPLQIRDDLNHSIISRGFRRPITDWYHRETGLHGDEVILQELSDLQKWRLSDGTRDIAGLTKYLLSPQMFGRNLGVEGVSHSYVRKHIKNTHPELLAPHFH